MFQYVSSLRSATKGRASYAMELDSYELVPPNVEKEIMAKYKGNTGDDGTDGLLGVVVDLPGEFKQTQLRFQPEIDRGYRFGVQNSSPSRNSSVEFLPALAWRPGQSY